MKRTKEYRADIDGLRAIAVLSVLLYHLKIPGFQGGFVGVDIFFVISGYLITNNINTQLQSNSFSFYRFYLSRFRRLFPALIVTILVSLLLGYLLLTPTHFTDLGASAVFATISLSNMFFWSEAGYFDTSAYFKPLLHTWSLSVEEQFYLVWPALLVCLRNTNRLSRNFLIFLIGILSLYFAERYLSTDPAAAYFWAPFRINEFAIGALLVLLGCDRPRNAYYEELLFALGLVLTLTPIFTFSDATRFPGAHALIPCIGAGILIYCGKARLLGIILRNKVAVGIGLISYSLYLVHWPVIVFYSYWKLGALGPKSQVLLFFATFIAALPLYFLVERKFRYSKEKGYHMSNASFGFSCVSVALVIIFLGAGIWTGNGWAWRYSDDALAVIHGIGDIEEKRQLTLEHADLAQNGGIPANDEPLYLVIGDSFAKDVLNAIKTAKPNINLKQLEIRAQCQPILPGDYREESPNSSFTEEQCNKERDRIFTSELLSKASYILIAASWREPGLTAIKDTLDYLHSEFDAEVVLFGARPKFIDVPSLALRHGQFDGVDEYVHRYKLNVAMHNAILKNTADETGVTFVDIEALLCAHGICPMFNGQQQVMYYDQAHWTMEGARYFGQKLLASSPGFLN